MQDGCALDVVQGAQAVDGGATFVSNRRKRLVGLYLMNAAARLVPHLLDSLLLESFAFGFLCQECSGCLLVHFLFAAFDVIPACQHGAATI